MAVLDPTELLLDVVGLYCYSMNHEHLPGRVGRVRDQIMPHGTGTLCQEPAAVVIRSSGEWLAYCAKHRPRHITEPHYEVAEAVAARLR